MNTKKMNGTLATFAAIVLVMGSGLAAASAQEGKATPDFTLGKKGEIHLNVKVKAGSVVLEPGMYQLQHAMEGPKHFVSFKAVQMPAGYRHGNTQVAREASARIECRVEPVEKKVSKTTITLRTNATGEKEIADVLIAGESFKHVL
jgi:hypothetical protein